MKNIFVIFVFLFSTLSYSNSWFPVKSNCYKLRTNYICSVSNKWYELLFCKMNTRVYKKSGKIIEKYEDGIINSGKDLVMSIRAVDLQNDTVIKVHSTTFCRFY